MQGNYAGKGVCRLLSLGAFCSWAREIDLYDHAGANIGLIEGVVLTTASAKFCLYGSDGVLVAIAYQDRSGAGVNLVTADKLECPLEGVYKF